MFFCNFPAIFARKPCKYKQIRSDQIPASVNVLKHCIINQYISRWNQITLKKYVKTILSPKGHSKIFSSKYIKNLPKRDIKTITIFCLSKSHQHICAQVTSVFHLNCNKNAPKQRWFFVHGNHVEKSSSKWRRYFVHRSYAEQSTSKRRRFFAHRNCIEGSTSKQRCLRWLTNLSFTGSSYREKWLTKVSNSDSAKFNYEFLDSSIWVHVTCNVTCTWLAMWVEQNGSHKLVT